MSAARRLTVIRPRPCDGCQACCVDLVIKELGKPAGEPCEHLSKTGCSVYHVRPEPCSGFFCLWTVDRSMPDEWRPDRCGVVLAESKLEDCDLLAYGLDVPDRKRAMDVLRYAASKGRVGVVGEATGTGTTPVQIVRER